MSEKTISRYCTFKGVCQEVFCVFSLYAQIPSVYSRKRVNTFSEYAHIFWAFSIDAYLFSTYSPNTQKGWRVRRKKFSLSTMPGDSKETVVWKNGMKDYILMMNSLQNIYFGLCLKFFCSLRSGYTVWRTHKTLKNQGKQHIFHLKVPSGQIGSKWKWYHWKAHEKDINRYMFLIF
jgi:hypothetical protein